MKSFIAALRSLVLPYGRTSGKRIVLDGENGRIVVYNADDEIVAEIALDIPRINSDNGGFVVNDPDGHSIAMVGEALHLYEEHDLAAAPHVRMLYLDAYDPDVTRLRLSSGRPTTGQNLAYLNLDASTTGARAEISATANTGTVADFLFTVYGNADVLGSLTADNIRHGLVTTPAPGAGGGTTTVNVAFADAMPNTPRVTISPQSSVDPGTVTIRGYVDAVSTAGFTIRAYRSTNSSTGWMYTAISD